MYNPATHIINKKTITIKVGDTEVAKKIQVQASQLARDKLPQIMEAALDVLDNGENITIGKLTIELTFTDLNDFNRNFSEKFKQKFVNSLTNQLQSGLPDGDLQAGSKPAVKSGHNFETNAAGPVGIGGDHREQLPVASMHRKTTWDTFEFYLENGVFPWWFAGTGADFIQALQQAWPKEGLVFLGDKIILLLKNPQKFQRFIQLISEDKLKQWAGLLAGNGSKELYKTVQFALKELKKTHPVSVHYMFGWIYYTAFVAHQKHINPTPENIAIMLNHWRQKMPNPQVLGAVMAVVLQQYSEKLPRIKIKKGEGVDGIIHQLVQQIIKKSSEVTLLPVENDEAPGTKNNNKLKVVEGEENKNSKTAAGEYVPVLQKKNNHPEEGVMIENAGLVLCWPYLATAFKKMGWVEEGQFKDIHSQKQAVLFLHYLAYKAMPEDESPLYLNKILCGLDTAEFIPVREPVGEGWEEIREGLLKAVSSAWEALKSSSVEGLVSTFIMRSGKVTFHNGPRLTVERKTLDVLLDRLPWPLSMIKFTWNKYIISVTW